MVCRLLIGKGKYEGEVGINRLAKNRVIVHGSCSDRPADECSRLWAITKRWRLEYRQRMAAKLLSLMRACFLHLWGRTVDGEVSLPGKHLYARRPRRRGLLHRKGQGAADRDLRSGQGRSHRDAQRWRF